MAHHGHVDAQHFDVLGRVDERLALADARPGGREVNGVRTQMTGGPAEAAAHARTRLEEQVDDHAAR